MYFPTYVLHSQNKLTSKYFPKIHIQMILNTSIHNDSQLIFLYPNFQWETETIPAIRVLLGPSITMKIKCQPTCELAITWVKMEALVKFKSTVSYLRISKLTFALPFPKWIFLSTHSCLHMQDCYNDQIPSQRDHHLPSQLF